MKNIRNSLVSGILATVIAAPALAGGPLNLNPNDPDNFERWPGGGANIPYNPDQNGIPGVMDAATVAAATGEWQSVASATATYSNNGTLVADIVSNNFCSPPPFNPGPISFPGCHLIDNLFFGTNVSDGLSPIVFDDDGSIFFIMFGFSGVLGFASPDTRDANGVPIEAVMFLNGGLTASGGGTFPDADFLGVTVHEFGHYSGMAHTVTNGQNIALGDQSGPSPFNTYGNAPLNQVETMYPFAIVGGGEDTLHRDDIAFFSRLYPTGGPGGFLATTAAISGTVFAPNGITPVTGVNVIARNVADPFVDAASAISGDRGATGAYAINGLTPGASYTIHIDQILQGGFSTPPTALPGPEEFYNGANESTDPLIDDPQVAVTVSAAAGGTAGGTNVLINGLAPGQIDLGDDDSEELFLPFTYTICGQDFDSVFVNSNGSLTFGSGDTDFTESTGEFLSDQPRIAALWDDLAPNNGGTVSFSQTSNRFSVLFENVPEFFATGANTFEITLKRSSNHIDINYGNVSANDGLAGVSCGGAITSRFESAEDLSASAPSRLNLHNQPARFEQFPSNDLANSTVRFTGTTDYNDNWAGKNDSLAKARNISLPFNSIDVVRFTEIEPAGGDVDYYSFDGQAGTTLIAEILTGQLDTVMGLFDPNGNLIAADDDGGNGLLSKLVEPLSADGEYTLAVSTFADFDFDGDGGSGGRYVLEAFAIDGILLNLVDDDSQNLSLGFTFPFNGVNYTDVWVNANGNLTFGSGDSDFTESVGEFLSDQPRIAPLWDDLRPGSGGLVIAEPAAGSMTVSFIDVPEWFSSGANTFAVTLSSDGSVDIIYDNVSATDGLVGVTEGGGAVNPGETDFSAAGCPSATGTSYEQFGFGDPFDLAGSALNCAP